MGYPCCPNKWNVYHECSLFCQNNWSSRSKSTGPEIDSEYFEIHKKTMEKYGPLPEDWQEKWDPGTGRHFYWCTRTGKFEFIIYILQDLDIFYKLHAQKYVYYIFCCFL